VEDDDDLLSMFLAQSGRDLVSLRKDGWVGNVSTDPTRPTAGQREADGLRAVTLYELEDW